MVTATPELRDYQLAALRETRAAYRAGARSIAIVIPTGGGKTVVAVSFALRAIAQGGRVLWVAHRRELVRQAERRMRRDGLDRVGVILEGKLSTDPLAPVQVCSVQTLVSRGERPPADVVVWDECFPAGTRVDGRPIETIRVGDQVRAFDVASGRTVERAVTRVFASAPRALVRVCLADGRALVCTPGHPFYVGNGVYRDAIDLAPGALVYRLRPTDAAPAAPAPPNDVLARVPARTEGAGDGRDEPALRFRAHAGTQPDAEARRAREDVRVVARDRTQALRARGQREACAGAAALALSGVAGRGAGARRADGPGRESPGALDALQDRRGAPRPDDRGRDRRGESLRQQAEGARRAQGGVLAGVRVDRVEVLERGSDGRYGGLCPDGLVYNLTVEGEHNYFAEGVLVHNCHHATAATWRQVASAYPNAAHLGLTATPARADGTALGNVADALVAPVTISALIRDGWLVPCDVIAPPERTKELAQDPADAVVQHAAGRRTVAFCANVPAAKRLAWDLQARGIAALCVDGNMDPIDRDQALASFAAGDTQVLTNVHVLTEGWDVPATEVCVLARGCSAPGTYLQMVGRVLRPAPGKSRALLVDLRGAVHEHGLPDQDRVYSLEGDPIRTADPLAPLRQCPVCGGVFRPVPACPRCAFVFPPPEAPAVKARELAPVTSVATPEEKRGEWERLCRLARAREYAPGWAAHRFRARFGHWPPRDFPRFEKVVAA